MKLTFLGTGAGVPSKKRNVSSLCLFFPEVQGETWLFDCGEGTQHQILTSPLKLSQINRIFITHLHGDHIYGLPGVLGSRSFQGGKTSLFLYGPKGIRNFIEVCLHTSQTHLEYPLHIIELDGEVTWELENFTIDVLPLEHRIPSFGYRIQQKDQPGSLQVDKLHQMGIPPGPLYGKLKRGESVQLEDGRVLRGIDFLGQTKPGKKIAIFGDTRITSNSIELARHVDLLIHEATYRAGQEDLAQKYFHTTSTQAAQLAKEADAKKLILHHISQRFNKEEESRLLEEAKTIFPQTFLAHDGWVYEMK